jgi:putative tryptophan/tyrosine transport system substrate-binding protein
MRRRDFIKVVAVSAITWPLAARAQQPSSTIRRVGILLPGGAGTAEAQRLLEEFYRGLKEYGWVDGQNITFEYRFANGKEDVLPQIAAELVQLRLDAIVAEGTAAVQAAKNATRTVPIVMALSNDPVASGFVASLNRPGGNITGLDIQSAALAGKRLQLLTEIVPGLARLAVLSNPLNPSHALGLKQMRGAAQLLGVEVHAAEAPAPDKFESAFATVAAARADALIVLPDGLFFYQHSRIVALTVAHHLPTLFPEKEVAEDGGLMAYGPSIPASFRRAAFYLDKILRGANPADLPVEQPTKFEFAINLKTAKTLGLTFPPGLLAIADEVIE